MAETPPFKITQDILNTSLRIVEKIGSIEGYSNLDRNPRLRRHNRVRSIYSSCAIEANSLSFGQVSDILNGHKVIGPQKDIDEIKGAISAYSMIEEIDPYNINDFLRIHSIMTNGTVQESGRFRGGGEGVFSNDRLIFMAPPPDLVPHHMDNLFRWMRENRSDINPLIMSSVFHYEMVFIHPFADGNGRMARFWQTALLGNWNRIFYWIPIENSIHKAQQEYYDSIQGCNDEGESTRFIEFMLRTILRSLEDAEFEINEIAEDVPSNVRRLVDEMDPEKTYSANELMLELSLKSGPSFKRDYLSPALDRGLIVMTDPMNPRSPKQRYRLG